MSKSNKKTVTAANITADSKAQNSAAPAHSAAAASIDWDAECNAIHAEAKRNGGDKGNKLVTVAKFLALATPAAQLVRSMIGPEGAKAVIEQSRNTLSKLPKLGQKLADGQAWCAQDQTAITARKKADASVACVGGVMLGESFPDAGMTATEVANAVKASGRYEGGASAQASAGLDVLTFAKIIARTGTTSRDQRYTVADRDALRVLTYGQPVKG